MPMNGALTFLFVCLYFPSRFFFFIVTFQFSDFWMSWLAAMVTDEELFREMVKNTGYWIPPDIPQLRI